jgi:predicted transcriptional regulator
MIVYIQDESYETRTNIINSIIDGLPTFDKDPKETVPYVENLLNAKMDRVQKLRDEAIKIKKFHAGTKTVAIRYTAKSSLREGITQLRELMPMMIGQKQIWESMITRMTINMLKVAAIHALANYRTYIDEPDIEYAASLMMQTMKSMGFFLREKVTTDIDKKTMQIYNSLRRKFIGIKNTTQEWENAIIENMNLSPNRAKQIISTLIENGKLEEISNKGQKAYIIK